MAEFDPYRIWLGIPPHEQPPNCYRLLGLAAFESDADAIANAADRQMAHVRKFQSGKNSAISQKILNELAAARICLLDPRKRAEYDAQLQAELAARELSAAPAIEPPPIEPPDAPPIALSPRVWPDVPAVAVENPPPETVPPNLPPAFPVPKLPAFDHHPVSRHKNRWKAAMLTVSISGILLLIAVWLIYQAIERGLFRPMVTKEVVRKSSPAKPPQPPAPQAPKTPPKGSPNPLGEKPKANEIAGKRLCFMQGDWAAGLPKLAASDNAELKDLAEKELADPENAAERLALADGWWEVAERYAPPAREQIRRHAVEWYQKAVGELDGADKQRAEERIQGGKPAEEQIVPGNTEQMVDPEKLE